MCSSRASLAACSSAGAAHAHTWVCAHRMTRAATRECACKRNTRACVQEAEHAWQQVCGRALAMASAHTWVQRYMVCGASIIRLRAHNT